MEKDLESLHLAGDQAPVVILFILLPFSLSVSALLLLCFREASSAKSFENSPNFIEDSLRGFSASKLIRKFPFNFFLSFLYGLLGNSRLLVEEDALCSAENLMKITEGDEVNHLTFLVPFPPLPGTTASRPPPPPTVAPDDTLAVTSASDADAHSDHESLDDQDPSRVLDEGKNKKKKRKNSKGNKKLLKKTSSSSLESVETSPLSTLNQDPAVVPSQNLDPVFDPRNNSPLTSTAVGGTHSQRSSLDNIVVPPNLFSQSTVAVYSPFAFGLDISLPMSTTKQAALVSTDPVSFPSNPSPFSLFQGILSK